MSRRYLFPVATHNYFKALNVVEERVKFLESSDYMPKFTYPKAFNEEIILSRQIRTSPSDTEYQSLECALSGARLQNDDNEFNNFRNINEKLFGAPDGHYAHSVLSRIMQSKSSKTAIYRDEIKSILGNIQMDDTVIGPSHETFKKYKAYFEEYRGDTRDFSSDIVENIDRELEKSGLSRQGWACKLIDSDSHGHVNHHTKTVVVGSKYQTRTSLAAERIAIHEVYGHAIRGSQFSLAESEGFAILLEQLLSDKFRTRRSYRYLAMCLGWGVFGKMMNFREVHEIIWRLMVISSRYSQADAKNYAFNECYRVFRGGRPDLPGALYLKDGIYFKANIDIWKILSEKELSYDDFEDIIEGRRAILT